MLDLFNTHFDFQDIRRDFIHGVLAEEVMDDKIRVHVTSQGYAARVKDFRTYDSLSKDIIRRWTHPFVPDNNINGLTTYQLHRNNVYKETGVEVARSAIIDRNSVIGSGTCIGENTFIRDSVIGRNCTIGTTFGIPPDRLRVCLNSNRLCAVANCHCRCWCLCLCSQVPMCVLKIAIFGARM